MERVRGSKVAIIGGSISGCAAALALSRIGCEVQVFERSSGILRDRGSGIALPPALCEELAAADYLPDDYPSCPVSTRLWILADGTPSGRIVWRQPAGSAMNNWGVLWREIRERVPDGCYHDGDPLDAFEDDGDSVTAIFADGRRERFDLLVAADGYRSDIRERLVPGGEADYAGYIMWRGNYAEERLVRRAAIDLADVEKAAQSVCFEGGHSISYTIPDFDDRTDPGHRRVNWAVYAPQPPELHFSEPTSIPPGGVTRELYAHLDRLLTECFPADQQDVIRESRLEEVSIQPVYDERIDDYTHGRVVLIGDAGSLTRAHTGSGATKALQDALCLERLGATHETWTDLLDAYDRERSAAGVALVEVGRRLGKALVEETPAWGEMSEADFDDWAEETLGGHELYFYRFSPDS